MIDEFSDQLVASGYSWEQTKDIVKSGLRGYENKVRKCREGNKFQYILQTETKNETS